MKIRKLKEKEIPLIAEAYEKVMSKKFKEVGEKPISKKKYTKILKQLQSKE